MNIFLGSISFEDRCSTAIQKLSTDFDIGFICCAREIQEFRDEHFRVFAEKIPDVREIVTSYTGSMSNFRSFQQVSEEIKALSITSGGLHLYWDVTTFRRENIALFMLAMQIAQINFDIRIIYTDATDYSTNEPPQQKWLSKGVSKVGTILGYNGLFAADKPLCLVIFLGIETERIRALIEKTAPSHVIFLLPDTKHVNLDEVRENVYRSVRPECSFELRYMNISDPSFICEELLRITKTKIEYNYGVCSFNSKRTVVGFCLAALKNTDIRLFYIWAEVYNRLGYSKGGPDVHENIIRLPDVYAGTN